jgi:hypothetical protein
MLQPNVYLRVNRRQFKGDRCQKPFVETILKEKFAEFKVVTKQ